MEIEGLWARPLTAALLTALILFFWGVTGCASQAATVKTELETAINALEPEAPPAPVLEPVRFRDYEGGLWLSYEDYRALERNVIALREYAARLKIIVEYYREEKR